MLKNPQAQKDMLSKRTNRPEKYGSMYPCMHLAPEEAFRVVLMICACNLASGRDERVAPSFYARCCSPKKELPRETFRLAISCPAFAFRVWKGPS